MPFSRASRVAGSRSVRAGRAIGDMVARGNAQGELEPGSLTAGDRHRKGGDLVRPLVAPPDPGDCGATVRARAFLRHAVLLDEVAVAAHEQGAAGGAVRVLEVADQARQVSGVDEAQPFFFADLSGSKQRSRAGVVWVGHLVVFVEGSHVPGNVGR